MYLNIDCSNGRLGLGGGTGTCTNVDLLSSSLNEAEEVNPVDLEK